MAVASPSSVRYWWSRSTPERDATSVTPGGSSPRWRPWVRAVVMDRVSQVAGASPASGSPGEQLAQRLLDPGLGGEQGLLEGPGEGHERDVGHAEPLHGGVEV